MRRGPMRSVWDGAEKGLTGAPKTARVHGCHQSHREMLKWPYTVGGGVPPPPPRTNHVGKVATYPLPSRGSKCVEKIRNGYLTPTVLGAHMGAKWLPATNQHSNSGLASPQLSVQEQQSSIR